MRQKLWGFEWHGLYVTPFTLILMFVIQSTVSTNVKAKINLQIFIFFDAIAPSLKTHQKFAGSPIGFGKYFFTIKNILIDRRRAL